MSRQRRFLVLGCATILAACTDYDSATGPSYSTGQSRQPAVRDMPSIDRFALSISAEGTFKPGEAIRIVVEASSNLPTEAAELKVILPEVELARRSAWDEGFTFDSDGDRLPPSHVRTLTALPQVGAIRDVVTVTIPAPGYYRAVAVLRSAQAEPLVFAGRWLQNQSVTEIWLLVTEDGGSATTEFEPNRIPEGQIRNPGPFRRASLPGKRNAGQAGTNVVSTIDGRSDGQATMLTPDLITYYAKYYNDDTDQYEIVPGASFVVNGCTLPPLQLACEPEDWYQLTTGASDANGAFYFECTGDEYEVNANTHAGASKFQVVNGANAVSGYVEADCGETFTIILPSAHARVFLNMLKTYEGFVSLFGSARSFINITLSTTIDASYYSTSEDRIYIRSPQSVWGEWGIFVASHEYGHAYHEDALWGNVASDYCPDPHFVDTETNLQCAFSEGFADYVGAATRPDVSPYSYRTAFEDGDYFPGCVSRNPSCSGTSTEGSLIEGAFAAFLYDLTDAVVEAHDSIGAPGSYLRDLIRSCEAKYFGNNWRRADGTDEIVYCVENAINPTGYLTERGGYPESYSESATEPGSWSGPRTHAAWTWNMYEKN